MIKAQTREKLRFLYGPSAETVAESLEALLDRYSDLGRCRGAGRFLTEQDVLLITYADSLREPGVAPLETLRDFYKQHLADLVSVAHLLPFFPYSSDDGFSVIDYRTVDSSKGDWADVERLSREVDLCFDLVCNHVSASSSYFRGFLAGQAAYADYFISLDAGTDTSSVLRPRTSPLLHPFDSATGRRWCWTTFSADQIDLNFRNPQVLLEILDVLLTYVRHGARILRLDAIAYAWKALGTSCAHLPQAHTLVQVMRDVLDAAAPDVLLLTETNVPHAQNISYFGDGCNEAQLVYNFALPPLVLHSVTAGDASVLTRWAATLQCPSPRTTFLNFTASHDGIGVRPVADLLDEAALAELVELAGRHGGQVSYKADGRGGSIPYELNINYFDALNNPNEPADPQVQVRRFLLSQSVALVLAGLPAVYLHSLLGSRGWREGAEQSGRARTINREKLDVAMVKDDLDRAESLRCRVFSGYARMIRCRRRSTAFDPNAPQRILDLGRAFFAVERTGLDGRDRVIALHNVSGAQQKAVLEEPDGSAGKSSGRGELTDLLTGRRYLPQSDGRYMLQVGPYETLWLATRL